jgi:hypothetical protein
LWSANTRAALLRRAALAHLPLSHDGASRTVGPSYNAGAKRGPRLPSRCLDAPRHVRGSVPRWEAEALAALWTLASELSNLSEVVDVSPRARRD